MLHAKRVDDRLEITAKRWEPQLFLERLTNVQRMRYETPIEVMIAATIERRSSGHIVLALREFGSEA